MWLGHLFSIPTRYKRCAFRLIGCWMPLTSMSTPCVGITVSRGRCPDARSLPSVQQAVEYLYRYSSSHQAL
jgi:hypothetical protein